MNFKESNRTWLRSTTALVTASAAAAAMMAPSGVAFAQDDEVDDEIIVTGSYIRRGNFDTPTPLNIVDQADILEQGSPNIADVIRQQTFNTGSAFQGNRANNSYQNGSFVEANLRGLGGGNSLTLMNGRRSASSNFEAMYPLIAVQRVETLLDGASALYGSDAVAGVINVIPFTDYEGMKIQVQGLWDDEFSHDTYDISMLFGAGNDTTHITAAFTWFDRSNLSFLDRPRNSSVSFGFSSTGNPGGFDVVRRDANGDPTGGLSRTVDPECANPDVPALAPTAEDLIGHPAQDDSTSGFTQLRSPTAGFYFFGCRLNFQHIYDYVPDAERLQSYVSITHDITDDLTFHAEGVYTRADSTQGITLTEPAALNFPTAGTMPGNPFRAATSDGDPLFARDLFNNVTGAAGPDGIPDRDLGSNESGLGLGDIILADNRFASINDDPDGGIPFYEDFKGTAVRAIGNLGPWPSQSVHGNAIHKNGGAHSSSTSSRMRLLSEVTWEIPNSNWFANVSYLMDRFDWRYRASDIVPWRMDLALNCEGGPDGDQCFNPFGNHAIDDAILQNEDFGGSGSALIELPVADYADRQNSQELVDWLFFYDNFDSNESVLNVIDVVVAGDLFDAAWAGDKSVGMAFGGQFRRERQDYNASALKNMDEALFTGYDADIQTKRNVKAVFAELALPIFDTDELGSMDLQGALRYEDFGGGLNSWDPKLAILWQPLDNLSLRASWGTSFVAPSVQQTSIRTVGLQNVPDFIFLGEDDSGGFIQTPIAPNPNLSPESSTNWNVGFSWEVIDDLTLSLDYWDFDFTDRIITMGARETVDLDNNAFAGAGGVFGNNDDARAWAGGPASANISAGDAALADVNIIRDPATGAILTINRARVNAATYATSGMDGSIRYRFNPSDWSDSIPDIGTFNWRTNATWVNTYKFQTAPDSLWPFEGPMNAVGWQNGWTNAAVPIPEWQVVSTIAWTYEDTHSASATVRWKSSIKTATNSALQFAGTASYSVYPWMNEPMTNEALSNPDYTTNLTDQATVDIQYTYRFGGWLFEDDRETTVTVGSLNVLDNKPPKLNDFGGTDTYMADVRGRMLYLRIGQEL